MPLLGALMRPCILGPLNNGTGLPPKRGIEKQRFNVPEWTKGMRVRQTLIVLLLLTSYGCSDQAVRRHKKGPDSTIDLACRWIARQQETDGHWIVGNSRKEMDEPSSDALVTGLALLALLDAGHSYDVGVLRGSVRKGVDWL